MNLEPLSASCHLNPIEEAFANVKHYLQQNDVVLHSVQDSSPLIWNTFGQIAPQDCLGYMRHAGYIHGRS